MAKSWCQQKIIEKTQKGNNIQWVTAKKSQATSVFLPKIKHIVDDLDKKLTLQGQGMSYVDHIMGIIYVH